MQSSIRQTPHSIEAEEAFLSCCFLDGSTCLTDALNSNLTPECFYYPPNRLIYELMIDMLSQGKGIDLSIIAQELKTKKRLDEIGGYAFLTQISQKAPTTLQVKYFIEKLIELNNLRGIIRESTKLVEDCYSYNGGGVSQILCKPLDRLLSIATGGESKQEPSWDELLEKAEKMADDIIANKGIPKELTLDFPFSKANDIFGPILRSQLVILAGNSSTGKSSLARQIASFLARSGKKIYFVTLEVDPVQVVLEFSATLSRVGLRQLGEAPIGDQNNFKRAIRSLNSAGITISRKDRWLAQIIARAKALHAKSGLDAIFIDYGELLNDIATSPDKEKIGAIGRLVAALKELAGNLNCAVVLLWQLNRDNAKGGANREPVLADLRGSGSLEHAGDKVILIYRPNTNPLTGEEQSHSKSVAEMPSYYTALYQAKGRNQGTGSVGFLFKRSIATFDQI